MFPFMLDLLNLLNFNFILISENKEVSVREDIQLFELGHDSHLWDYKVSHDPVKDCERQRQLQERLMIFPQAHWENVTSSCESVSVREPEHLTILFPCIRIPPSPPSPTCFLNMMTNISLHIRLTSKRSPVRKNKTLSGCVKEGIRCKNCQIRHAVNKGAAERSFLVNIYLFWSFSHIIVNTFSICYLCLRTSTNTFSTVVKYIVQPGHIEI